MHKAGYFDARQKPLARRDFLRACVGAGALVLGSGALGLGGCASYNVSSTVPSTLEDKRHKPEDDKSYMADELTVSLRLLASEAFTLALPALQDKYASLHANVEFLEPEFLPSAEISTGIASGKFNGVFTDLESPMTQAINDGLIDTSMREFIYSAKVNLVGSSDVSGVSTIKDICESDIENILIGNTSTVFSGIFANQVLYKNGLYSAEGGVTGTYASEIASKVSLIDSVSELVKTLEESTKTVGFVLSSEAKVFGLDPLLDISRSNNRSVYYQAAPLLGTDATSYALDFISYCANETEAAKVADMFALTSSS